MTALTTEHFTLQGARSQTASESASRASLYILSVSSALVALGFIGQASQVGTTFDVFALTVLPTLDVLGVFTFVRAASSTSSGIGGTVVFSASGRLSVIVATGPPVAYSTVS